MNIKDKEKILNINNKILNINNKIIDNGEHNIKYISPDFRIFFIYNPDKADIKINQN